jgi:hypothetical protein
MSWQGQMGTIVRYLIDDVDPDKYEYSDHRIETTILVAGQLSQISIDYENDYDINVENCTLSPDPTKSGSEDEAFIESCVYNYRRGNQIWICKRNFH